MADYLDFAPAEVREQLRRERDANQAPVEAPRIQTHFDFMPPELRNQYSPAVIEATRQNEATRDRIITEDSDRYLSRRAIPFVSAISNAVESYQYGQARSRIAAGRPERNDQDVVRVHEAMLRHDEQRGLGGQIVSALAHAPAIVGEFAVGGEAVRGLGAAAEGVGLGARALRALGPTAEGAGLGARIGQHALRTAAITPLIPSSYLPQLAEDNLAAGRSATDPRGLPAAMGVAYVNNLILGGLSAPATRLLPGGGLGRAAGRIGISAGAGVAEQAVADVMTGALGMQAGYGTLGDIAHGRYGDALKHAVVQATTFAAFGLMHEIQNPRAREKALEKMQDVAQTIKDGQELRLPKEKTAEIIKNHFPEAEQLSAQRPRPGEEAMPNSPPEHQETQVSTPGAHLENAPPETAPTPPPEPPKAPVAAETPPSAVIGATEKNQGSLGGASRATVQDPAIVRDATEALRSTGFKAKDAKSAIEKAVATADRPFESVQELITAALPKPKIGGLGSVAPAPAVESQTKKRSILSELLAKSNELGIESAKAETDAEKSDVLERRLKVAKETRAETDKILSPKESAVLWERIEKGTTHEQIAKDKIVLRDDGKPYTGRAGIKEVEKRALEKLADEAGQDVSSSIAESIHKAEADAGKRAKAAASEGVNQSELTNTEGKKGKKKLTLDDRIEHLNDRYEGIIEANNGVHTPEIHARYTEDAKRMYKGEASRMTEEMLDAIKESIDALGANARAVRKVYPELSIAQANELIRDIQGGKDAIGIEAARRARLGLAEVLPASAESDRPADTNTATQERTQDAEASSRQPPNDSGLGTNAAGSGGQAAGLGAVKPDKEGSRRFASGVESETALAKGVAAEEREAMGLPKQQEADRIANAKTNAEAGAAIAKDPSLPAKLLADLAKSSRATTALENAILLRHKTGLEAKLAKAEQAANAEKDPKTKADLYVQSDKLRTEFQDFLDVVGKQGTTAGRALQFYAQLMKQDYSLGGMLRRAEAAAKRPLEPKEREKIGDQAKEIQHATEEMQKKAEAVDKGGWDDKGAQDSYEEAVLNQRRKIVEHQDDIAAFRWKAMTPGERAIDWLKKLRVAELISSPITLGKVGSSGILQTFAPAVNNMVGAGLRMLPGIRPIAAKAAIEGHGFNAANEGAAIKAAGTTGLKAGWDTIKNGRSNLDIRYGPDPTTPRVWADWVGDLHAAEKAPAVEAMFQRTRLNLMDAAKAKGDKLTSGLIENINKQAYEKSKEAKFQEDGAVADQVSKLINALKKSESPLGRVVGHAVDVMLPIRKTPGNIVAAAFEHALGLPVGGTRLGIAHLKGIENLTSPQAEGIMRQLKKGTLGIPLLMLGYFASGSLGGFYSGRRTEDEVQEGEIKTPLGNLPSWVTAHHPAFMALQLGASIRRAEEDVKKNGRQGLGTGIAKGLGALMEEIPYVKEQTEVARAFEGGFNENAVGRIAASFAMPALFQFLATSTDRGFDGKPQLRKPEGFLQQIEARTPGLRQMTPEKVRAVEDLHTEMSRLATRREEAAHRGERFDQEREYNFLHRKSLEIAKLEHRIQGDVHVGRMWFGRPADKPDEGLIRDVRQRQAEFARAALEAIR